MNDCLKLTGRQFLCLVQGVFSVFECMGLGPKDDYSDSRLDLVEIRIKQPRYVNGAVDVSVGEYPSPRPAGVPPVLTPGGPSLRGVSSPQKS